MKQGQVWIETVIYTLVGLALIGFVLSLSLPKINEYRDKSVIEGTLASFDKIDEKLNQVLSAPGNIRIIDLILKRGTLTFDAEHNSIVFELEESSSVFSEPGITTRIGRVNVTTEQTGKKYSVLLVLPVTGDLVLKDSNESSKKLAPAAIPYKLSFENLGLDSEGNSIIAFKEASGA
jgi:hypothetical protein